MVAIQIHINLRFIAKFSFFSHIQSQLHSLLRRELPARHFCLGIFHNFKRKWDGHAQLFEES